jgi:predicted glutamine amidotransferase
MCRVLAYLGQPLPLSHLLYEPDSSLVRQAHSPRMLSMLNLAGFGMMAWDHESYQSDVPFSYRTTEFPVFDRNLRRLSDKVWADAVLAHVRGVRLSDSAEIGASNLHPFRYHDVPLALAHNGDLASFDRMRYDLLEHVKPEIAAQIRGSTDSEWIYALLLSQLPDPSQRYTVHEYLRAVEATLSIIRRTREKAGIAQSSSVNLFLCDGHQLVATRFTFDFGCYGNSVHEANLEFLSLWFTFGSDYGLHDGEWKMVGGARNAASVIVSSEPLTRDVSAWLELPEYHALYVSADPKNPDVGTVLLDV